MVENSIPPTEQQLVRIAQLGRGVGLGISKASIVSKEQAEQVITCLLLMRRRELHYKR